MTTRAEYEESLKPKLPQKIGPEQRRQVIERRIIHWCAPALAGIKPSNLFTFVFQDGPACRSCPDAACRELKRQDFEVALRECRPVLGRLGIGIAALAMRPNGALVLVYRHDLLTTRLHQPQVAAYLMQKDYNPFDTERCLWELARRIRWSDCMPECTRRASFPHEVGFLLGYPYEEVVAFIEGRSAGVLTGAWKAYGRVDEARDCANRYRRCRSLYEELYQRGARLPDLAGMSEAALEDAVRAA